MRLPTVDLWHHANPSELTDQIKWGSYHFSSWHEALDLPTKEAIEQYRQQSDSFNRFLRSPEEVILWSHEKTQQIAAQAAMLTTAIRKMSLPEDITVYRGLRGDDLPGIEVGKPFIEYGFVATTLALSIAEEFSEWDDPEDMATILAIRIPRDHPGVWIQEMFDCDQRNEYEIVLPPMTTLVPEAVFPVSFTYQSLPDFQVPKRRCAICRCITTPI